MCPKKMQGVKMAKKIAMVAKVLKPLVATLLQNAGRPLMIGGVLYLITFLMKNKESEE